MAASISWELIMWAQGFNLGKNPQKKSSQSHIFSAVTNWAPRQLSLFYDPPFSCRGAAQIEISWLLERKKVKTRRRILTCSTLSHKARSHIKHALAFISSRLYCVLTFSYSIILFFLYYFSFFCISVSQLWKRVCHTVDGAMQSQSQAQQQQNSPSQQQA